MECWLGVTLLRGLWLQATLGVEYSMQFGAGVGGREEVRAATGGGGVTHQTTAFLNSVLVAEL